MRRVLVAISALVVVAAICVSAIQRSDERFTPQEVERAFAGQGIEVGDLQWLLGDGGDDKLGVSSPEVTSGRTGATALFELPLEKAQFYILVATNAEIAEGYYDEFVRLGQTPDSFDALRGNVLVISGSSVAEHGLSPAKKARINAALTALGRTG